MALYQKQIKYSLYETVPAYGFNLDGCKDALVGDTGWIAEEEDVWFNKQNGPYALTETRWGKREERYVKIDAAPVVHGRWIGKNSPYDVNIHICSVCREQVSILGNKLRYCPNCGAKMDSEN